MFYHIQWSKQKDYEFCRIRMMIIPFKYIHIMERQNNNDMFKHKLFYFLHKTKLQKEI